MRGAPDPLDALLGRGADLGDGLRWSVWRRQHPARARDDKPSGNHKDRDRRLEQ
jgi:hypothetical protein